MKITFIIIGIVAAVIALVVVIGAMLPKHHIVTRSAFIKASPEQVFQLISGPPDWRTDLKTYSVIEEGGKHIVRETDKHGQTVTYERIEYRQPTLLKTVIADQNLPFGGGWTWNVQPQNDGCLVTIIEDGEIYNPVFRFVSRFLIGYTRTIDDYLTRLAQVAESRR
ncbi:MAG TPA: SRPBCC family protein [Terriglobales bacterium]|nr:SRPBCC family protein [Terriglobales bacterium]